MTPVDLILSELRKGAPGRTDRDLLRVLEGWALHPFYEGDELKGVAMTKGTEFHCHLVPGFRLNRRVMREFMRPLFERHGFLTTRVHRSDEANQRFNRVFGFERTWSDDQFHYYILTALPFEGRT